MVLPLAYGSGRVGAKRFAAASDAVNPWIGTAADGNTFPGATLPLGMMSLWDRESGFIRPRAADGSFIAGWDPRTSAAPSPPSWDSSDQMGFEEGSTWQ